MDKTPGGIHRITQARKNMKAENKTNAMTEQKNLLVWRWQQADSYLFKMYTGRSTLTQSQNSPRLVQPVTWPDL